MRIQRSDHFTYAKLFRFTAAPIAMMVFTSIYGVVDGLFVSNFVGKTAFAALNLIYPVYMLFGALGFMTGTGGSALTALALGERRSMDACRCFSFMVYLTAALGAAAAIAGELFLPEIARALEATGELYAPCMDYGRVLFAGLPFYMLQNVFQAFFATAEKPLLGFSVSIAAGVANMALDALLVAVFPLGIWGAAVATVISQIVGAAIPIAYFAWRNSSLLRLGRAKFEGRVLLKACANGSSELISNISMSIVSILYNAQLMRYAGENGVAAYGVLMYVGFIFFAIFMGYSLGAAPVIAYNLGAQNFAELKNLFKKSMHLMAAAGVAMTALSLLLARPLSLLFVGYDPALCSMTAQAMWISTPSFLLMGFGVFGSALFTALNNGLISAIISFARTFVFQIGCVLLIPLLFGLNGIWLSLVAAELLGCVVVFAMICARRGQYRYY